MSLMAALQPSDIKEAVEVTQGTITHTKLRLVYSVARVMFELDPIDVGAPPIQSRLPVSKAARASRSDGGLSMRVKVSSILDQSSDREVERISREELNALRGRFRSLEGEDLMKADEVTDDQLSVLAAVTKAGVPPYADFGVWKTFGQRAAKNLTFTSHFLDHSGAWRRKEVPGPDSFATWEACWRVFRTAARPVCWTAAQPSFVSESTGSPMLGTSACWLTPDADPSCGSRNFGGSRSFMARIRSPQRSCPVVRGTV